MWPHFKTVQRSKSVSMESDAFESLQRTRGHQSGNDLHTNVPPRATSSVPAHRTSRNPHSSKAHNGDYGKSESVGISSYRGEKFSQLTENNSDDNIPRSDVLPIKEKQAFQQNGYYRRPLQENFPFSRDLPCNKNSPGKQQRCHNSNDSLGSKIKRKHFPHLHSLTNDELQPSRKKYAAAPDTPRVLSDVYDPTKPINYQSTGSSASKFFNFSGETETFANSRKSLDCHNFGSFSAPSVQHYPSPDDIGNSKENLPTPFLSPESLELPKEAMSSPESVCERLALNRGHMDEDNDESVAQSDFLPTMDSFSQETLIHEPMSPIHESNWDFTSVFSQLQPVQTDPDEEYEKLMSAPRDEEGIHHHDCHPPC